MKKVNLMIVMIALMISTTYAQSAVIREMTGTVELQREGSGAWAAAKVGDRLEQNTIISTGFKSTAILAVGSSTIVVRPITRLSLKELTTQNQTETTNINLNTGRVRVEVTPPAGTRANFTVQTPSATASVRGTAFEMDTVNIKVLTGAVSFAPAGQVRAVTVSAGQSTVVDTETGTAVPPIAAAEAERNLPALPGQSAGVTAGSSIIPPADIPDEPVSPPGSGDLIIDITLE